MKPFAVMRMRSTAGGGGVSYTTLNPSDKSGSITLSGANLVANGSTNSGIARSVQTITGKKYFEAVFTSVVTSGTAVIAAGVANGSASLSASLGYSDANGWAFWGTGTGARHNGSTAVSVTSFQDDVIGFAVDEPGHKLWIRVNGTWLASGDPVAGTSPIWTDLSGTLYAAACPWDGDVVTMRFDPASFRDAAPSGFSAITA